MAKEKTKMNNNNNNNKLINKDYNGRNNDNYQFIESNNNYNINKENNIPNYYDENKLNKNEKIGKKS